MATILPEKYFNTAAALHLQLYYNNTAESNNAMITLQKKIIYYKIL